MIMAAEVVSGYIKLRSVGTIVMHLIGPLIVEKTGRGMATVRMSLSMMAPPIVGLQGYIYMRGWSITSVQHSTNDIAKPSSEAEYIFSIKLKIGNPNSDGS